MEAFMLLVTDSRHDFEVLESLKSLPRPLRCTGSMENTTCSLKFG